jgi:hypothetical protein
MSRSIRRAQAVSPYGVGALITLEGQGFLMNSIDKWPSIPPKIIRLSRLSKAIGGNVQLRSFDDQNSDLKNQKIKMTRFPKWYHCVACGKLDLIDFTFDRNNEGLEVTPKCLQPKCNNTEMTPMRFVAYCDSGHLTEVNWHTFSHRSEEANHGRCSDKTQLFFKTSGHYGGDFDSMFIECKSCNRPRQDFTDIKRGSLPSWMLQDRPENPTESKCCGKQPWQKRHEAVECTEEMRIEPRGSTSLYAGRVFTALDIENVNDAGSSDEHCEILEDFFIDLKDDYASLQDLEHQILSGYVDAKINRRALRAGKDLDIAKQYLLQLCSQNEVAQHVSTNESSENIQEDILQEELKVFQAKALVDSENLSIEFHNMVNSSSYQLFSAIGQVKKLKEVRSLVSFSRGKGTTNIPVDLGEPKLGWIPSIEAFGEGIFFELNANTINKYFKSHGEELNLQIKAQQQALEKMKEIYPVQYPSDRLFIIIHTLSHLLIRQLTFNSGYSSSSLRERIYVDQDKNYAGVLIYTTDTDSEGTLGGLVDQGRPELVDRLSKQISELSSWCSSDPVCRENQHQGFQNLNSSACHCCCLISETSCMYQNALLNRLVLGGLGKGNRELKGFVEFSKVGG